MSLPETDIDARIGARIRGLRTEKNLTLDGLAHLADVSRAMLSRIERGESSPTAQLLGKICGGLGITLSTLFAATETPASPLLRRREQPTWRDPASQYLRRQVSPPGTGSPVDIVEVEFPPGGSVAFDTQRLAGTDQHVWVLDGTLELRLGEEVFRLETGDCLLTRFDRPILFHNPTGRPVRYAVVISHGAMRP
ncbi:XRE family transcriptional regulator [Rhodovastum atsumiense]|uniref:XRE family transcriptional regulator n=1 Tax=Rhodovastum atsumiense TaxID=504468 RepID=A0A5M6INA7_9PROT|nr:helix-turn-helix domain-containing protein [Rhodovastum atsumiense]KAA5609742.1 XRE family transcriptional regulator [Rhodovastum atsumiense]CAH2604514.1 XRE family transcriptional regulator [Rhodovastum atsumiense]